ncbi:MAG: hypothetical protein WC799_17235 [Desulfobacteraceae bacterium]|jgi:hypothetical protein
MKNKLLVTDEEYAKEVKSHSDYLNWVFGLSTIFLSISCLQFPIPWRPALVCLFAIIPMYIYAVASFPVSLKILRELYKETKDKEVKNIIAHLESRFHGWRIVYTNLILMIGLLLYVAVLLSASPHLEPVLKWIKA